MFRFLSSIFFLLSFTVELFSQQWKELGPCGSVTYGNHVASQGGTGQVHCITFDPDNPAIVYCGSPYGGLWKSVSGGKSWTNDEIDVDQALALSSVCDIAITTNAGQKIIWIATGHPGGNGITDPYTSGIYFSDNGGRNFKPVESFNSKFHFHLQDAKHISRIVAHPRNANTLFVATSDGLYQTLNGGKSWKLVLTEDELPGSNNMSKGIFSVEFSKTNPDKVVYACGKDIYRSIKGGKRGSFKTMTHAGLDFFESGFDCLQNVNFNIDLNRDSLNKDLIYAMGFARGDTCGELRGRTSSLLFFYNGSSWEQRKRFPIPNEVDGIRLKIASVSGNAAVVYAGVITTNVSSDFGKTWKQATEYNQPGHADIHAVEIVPGTNDLITGTDGGIFRYHYENGKIDEYNNGLCISTVIDMGLSATNPKKILIGKQDTGADLWDGTEWTKLPTSGDGYSGQLIDEENENHLFTCSNFQFYESESTSGFNFKSFHTCLKPPGVCPYVFVQSERQPNVFYCSERELYRSVDGGKKWCRISDFMKKQGLYFNPSGHIISAIAPAPSDSNTIYVSYNANPGCCNSFLFKTEKGGMLCGEKCDGPAGEDTWKYLATPRIETGNPQDDFLTNSFYYISGITVSDKDPNKVWICYASSGETKTPYKIYKSTDGGNTWIADEAGLPEFSFKKIVYLNGSEDVLFAACNDGVYYKSGNADWKRLGQGLPKVYVSDIEVSYGAKKLRAATYGRGVWEIDLPK